MKIDMKLNGAPVLQIMVGGDVIINPMAGKRLSHQP